MKKSNENYQIRNEEIEKTLKDLGSKIGSQLPSGWGFNLTIASYGEKGSTFYISNMERQGSIDMLKELIERLENGQ